MGKVDAEESLFGSTRKICESQLPASSLFRLLADKSHEMFPAKMFEDLFSGVGRPSIPPRVVAVVMVLQRHHGMSDREAVGAFAFDLRWKYAAGCLAFEYPGFCHSVLVEMRARLAKSERPNRLFEATVEAAVEQGIVGRKRVFDSTALYDAVATQDTVTLVRNSIVGLLGAAPAELAAELRAECRRDDEYCKPGKPACDWDDKPARDAMLDGMAADGYAMLARLHDLPLDDTTRKSAELLATVLGQDLEMRHDGVFRIADRVQKGRVISTVDPEARHGHKTTSRKFDGYKGHIVEDPDSEIITDTAVTAGNVGDAEAAHAVLDRQIEQAENAPGEGKVEVYGDGSFGAAELLEKSEVRDVDIFFKVQEPSARAGCFSQNDFEIDLNAGTAKCPNGVLVQLRLNKDGSRSAEFGPQCTSCPLRAQCTQSKSGRTLRLHPKHEILERHRKRQRDPEWKKKYRSTRPKVERKFAHLMRHKHGGRRARVRGQTRVAADFALLAAAANLARLAVLRTQPSKWANDAN